MPQASDAPARVPSRIVRLALVALVALVASPSFMNAPVAAAVGSTTTSTVTVDRPSVQQGGQVGINVVVTSTVTANTLVDVEIYDTSWRKVFQTWWDNERLAPGTSGSYNATWSVPPGLPAGTYVVMVGVFASGWTSLYGWNARAATVTVAASGQPSTTTPGGSTSPTPPTTTPPTTTPPTTTPPTTGVVTTTTVAPTTTVAATTPTTVPAVTTTTAAPVPPPPPANVVFSEDFTTPAGVNRFDWQLHSGANSGPCGTVSQDCGIITATDRAEHDMACGSPTTARHIAAQPVHDLLVLDPATSPLMYYCAPGNDPAKGHVMTVVETEGVMSLSFSPKQTFNNVNKVCFDINTNDTLGGGKWINAWIVPTSSLAANGGRFDFADAPELDPEQQAPGPDDFHFKYFDGSLIGPNGFDWWEWRRRATESATRFTQCVEQTAPGLLTYTRDLAVDANGDGQTEPGVVETVTRTGTGDLPDGDVRVIFQDGSYNPDKHGGLGAITWHWDNIAIS